MDGLSLATLTGWDWFVILVTAGSVVLGALRGLIRTVFGVGAWVVALIGAPLSAPMLIEVTGMQAYPWVVLAVLFFVLLVVVKILGNLLARALGKAGFGTADRSLGALLGVARALLLVLLVAVGAHALKLDQTVAWRASHSRPLLDALVQWASPYLPQRISGIREA